MLWTACILFTSVFFYTGADTDVFTLHLLSANETDIIYVEPLIAFRNRDRITKAKASMTRASDIDELFECKDGGVRCAEPLTKNHTQSYLNWILEQFRAVSECDMSYNALRGFRVVSSRAGLEEITVEFEAAGILRHLRVIISTIQNARFDLLHNREVSTYSRMGLGNFRNTKSSDALVLPHVTAPFRLITAQGFEKTRIGRIISTKQHDRCTTVAGGNSQYSQVLNVMPKKTRGHPYLGD